MLKSQMKEKNDSKKNKNSEEHKKDKSGNVQEDSSKKISYLKQNSKVIHGTFNSANNPVNHVNSARTEVMLLYSSSAELLDTVCYFLDFQDIKNSPKYTTYPVTDLLVFGHAAQSESHQHTRSAVG
ncbi:hypothetical protein BC332_12948 [Capsicum chinense]|nr:hypothetical protein BC332_12948 [Capsicum chinense]